MRAGARGEWGKVVVAGAGRGIGEGGDFLHSFNGSRQS